MKFLDLTSDERILRELGDRIARYRLNKNWTQARLAEESGVSSRTIHNIEHGAPAKSASLIRVLRVLGLLNNLELLIPEPVVSPVQQLKMQGKSRRRATGARGRSRRENADRHEQWTWDDAE